MSKPLPSKEKKRTVADIASMKNNSKISVLTAYDYCSALICDRAGVDILLVGDSAGMVVLGYPNTARVEMSDMLLFCGAVSRGAKKAMVVGDMPFGSYQSNVAAAVENAVRMVKAGCDAVKLEGGAEVNQTIESIVAAGIPVMGHIGLKPQTATLWEGYKVQGKNVLSAQKLQSDALTLQEAGVFSIVLEMVSSEAAGEITKALKIPTIGIGAGPACDGQVLVLHDLIGMYEDIKPKFAIRNANVSQVMFDAVSRYSADVKGHKFPSESHTFHMDAGELDKWKRAARKDKADATSRRDSE